MEADWTPGTVEMEIEIDTRNLGRDFLSLGPWSSRASQQGVLEMVGGSFDSGEGARRALTARHRGLDEE